MDQLADFLLSAHWQQTGQNTYFCDDPGLDTIWIKVAEQLPSQLKGCGLQAWKIKGIVKMVEPKGVIQSVSGEGAIVGGQTCLIKRGIILTGSFYFILAIPNHPIST
ncbi:uncharacterized protein BO88DRAFT_426212 [Aspergillus vadensis CBS 113365]|uniref:Uncharacterized protein n=1 Tax=Aspergillus vadensis (strain CBS 113365 / IMI 142717 / IBT 24658) TaxID=1448311 RepID=A0A319BY81_ASPVC|nr:hypothetical protein BO88DRAFT_426212 [Aspergillus vadensis CBS 113365]PYH68098.1 hypothetical protein BO88DRAFT_426212 [Aspergillus vadensis CBS 113365]